MAEPKSYRNFIDGEWVEATTRETFEDRNPADKSEVVGSFQSSAQADVDAAVESARKAARRWRLLPAPKRAEYLFRLGEILLKRKEEYAREMTREMGKPLREARIEAARAATILRFFGGEGYRPMGELSQQTMTGGPVYTMRRPLGVVGLITPWNFPAAIPAWKLAPALAYGNAAVLKLATDAPVTGLRLAECLAEAGLPAGVLNVLTGSGSKVGNAIVRDPRVRAISFTGSVPVGQSVRDEATKLGKRVQLELGGHNPMIVLADAKIDAAVEAAYAGAFWSAGQKCTATRRIYVHDSVYDTFRKKLLDRIASGKVGDPGDPETEVGPIVNEKQFDEIVAAIERGRREGGEVIAGGGRADETGYVIEPTVFEGVRDDAFLSCEEVFGPVTSLYRIGDLDEGLRRANAVEFGLSAAIFTQNLEAAQRFTNEAEAGLLHVNSQTAGAEVHVPFGGIKASGFGPHEQGRAALEFYTEIVTVYQDV